MMQPITTRTRFKVTTCLYLIPNRRANSRSMRTMAGVMIETPQRVKVKTICTFKTLARMFEFIFATASSTMYMARIGLAIRPTV